MQKVLLASAVAVSLSLVSLTAAAQSAPFVSLKAGNAHYDTGVRQLDGSRGMSYEVMGGYRWQAASGLSVGVEGGYVDLSSSTHRVSDPAAGKAAKEAKAARAAAAKKKRPRAAKSSTRVSSKVTYLQKTTLSASALVVGANLRWAMSEHWALTGRAGLAHTRLSLDHRAPGTKFKARASGYQPYAGLGVAYVVNEKVDIGISATRYAVAGTEVRKRGKVRSLAINNVSAGVEVRF